MKEYLNRIYKEDEKSFLAELSQYLKNETKKFIVTVNPESLMEAQNDSELSNLLLDNKTLLVPDGIAVVKACRKIGLNIKQRITGIDIAKFLLEEADKNKYSMYLFGAKEEVISQLINIIKNEYKNINIIGYSNGYIENKEKEMQRIVKLNPDICMVALGIPDQEKLIYKYVSNAKKGIYIGVGGSFDVLSGAKKRAPKLFIKLNLEWLYRIITEPKRIKRFWNNNIKFLFKVKK